MVWHVFEQTKWRDHIARKMTQKFEESFTSNIFVLQHSCKGDLTPKKGKHTKHFQSATQTHTIIIRTVLACNQL